jgi:Zn finger protein HypA/HybF involved in hydrogenase expression
MPLPKGALPVSDELMLTPQQKTAVAEIMLKGRNLNPGTYPAESFPDKVVIQELSDQYEPVAFAHGKHVAALAKGTQGSRLAQYFHYEPGTLCQGCHHNSPASLKPPRCSSCHAQYFDVKQPARPGLQAALHGQCMRCHQEMAVKPVATACTECHQAKKK